jgi:hypothetical protein
MKLNWKSFFSLKIPVIISFVVIWNAGFIYAAQLGEGIFSGGFTPLGMKITGMVCVAASIFSFCVAFIKPFQSMVVAESRLQNFSVKEFYFLALIAGVLAISRFTFPAMVAQ